MKTIISCDIHPYFTQGFKRSAVIIPVYMFVHNKNEVGIMCGFRFDFKLFDYDNATFFIQIHRILIALLGAR